MCTYVIHFVDPKFSQTDNTKYITEKYFNYFTYRIQMLQQMNYMQLIKSLGVILKHEKYISRI